MIGSTIGSYRVLDKLGEGGMGEVYRARDTKLDRDVAIKILSDAFASDPDRLVRFEREARTLAALNHPNIAQIYGLEDSGPVRALVIELVDGSTLEELLAAGADLSIGDKVTIARQIAEALEAAHDHGIIHRDLKPANIKVRRDGAVKVLDFGLARAMDPRADSGPTTSPTFTAATRAGVILGTAAYMSPEQARGLPVDKRADIWSFGVVCYELLSGRRLFDAATASDTLAAVLRQDIDLSRLPADVPPALVELTRRCLERDATRRLRDIGEARIALDAPEPRRSPSRGAEPSRAPVRVLAAVTVVLAMALAAALVAIGRSWTSRTGPGLRMSAILPDGVTFNPDVFPVVAISRDGSTIAMIGMNRQVSRIYVRKLDDFDPRPLAGTEGASMPFFSPDGAWIGFFADGKLKKTPAAGGPVVTLATAVSNRGAVWTDADSIVFTPDTTSALFQMAASGGAMRPLTTLDAASRERTHRWPAMMPDGRTVVFNAGSVAHADDYDDSTIETVRLDTGDRRILQQRGRMPHYIATGDLLYLRGRVLYGIPIDAGQSVVRSTPVPLIDGVVGDPTTGAASYAVSANGTLIYVAGEASTALPRRLVWVSRQGSTVAKSSIDVPAARYADLHVSPAGRVATTIIDPAGSARDVWIVDPARRTSVRLTSRGVNRTPVWSRDGRRVFYVRYEPDRNRSTFVSHAIDGGGAARVVGTFEGQSYLEDVSPDGTTLFMQAIAAAGNGHSAIYRLPADGNAGDSPVLFISTSGDTLQSSISPDGRWIAVMSTEAGRQDIFVQSLAPGSARTLVSSAGGVEPHWAPDGRALYYVQNGDMFMVKVEPGTSWTIARPERILGEVPVFSTESARTYAVSPADGRFLMMHGDERPPLTSARIAVNWFVDVRSRRLQ